MARYLLVCHLLNKHLNTSTNKRLNTSTQLEVDDALVEATVEVGDVVEGAEDEGEASAGVVAHVVLADEVDAGVPVLHLVGVEDGPFELDRLIGLLHDVVMLGVVHERVGQHVEEDGGAVGEVAADGVEEAPHLCLGEVHQHAFEDEEHGPTVGADGVDPAEVEEGHGQVGVALGLGQEAATEVDGLGQIEVVPVGDGRAAQAVVAGVDASAELYDDGVGVGLEELLGLAVDQVGADATADLRHGAAPELREVIVDAVHDFDRFRVAQQGVRPIRFGGLGPEGDEHGFGYAR